MNKPKPTQQDERLNGEKYMIISFFIYVLLPLHFSRIYSDYQTFAVKGEIRIGYQVARMGHENHIYPNQIVSTKQ